MATVHRPTSPVSPLQTRLNRAAFLDALYEYGNDDMRETLMDAIRGMSKYLQLYRGMGEEAADGTATEFFAACVWGGVKGKVKKGSPR